MLFTLDKLIYKMVKQTQLIAQDELAMKLVDLARYEASRTIPNADAVHKANARVLLSDEPVYRFQTRGATSLAVQLQEFDGSDVQPGRLRCTTPVTLGAVGEALRRTQWAGQALCCAQCCGRPSGQLLCSRRLLRWTPASAQRMGQALADLGFRVWGWVRGFWVPAGPHAARHQRPRVCCNAECSVEPCSTPRMAHEPCMAPPPPQSMGPHSPHCRGFRACHPQPCQQP